METRSFNAAIASAISMGATSNNAYSFQNNGAPISVEGCHIQAIVSAGTSPVGTLNLQVSNDDTTSVTAVTNWSDVSGSSFSVTANGNFDWEFPQGPRVRHIRLTYTRTSGTATLNARINWIGNI